jgi:hypothetical protein
MFSEPTPPIVSEYANSFAPSPVDTVDWVFSFTVVEVPPVISSPLWNAPVSLDNLFMIRRLFFESFFRIVPVAFEFVPVTTSPSMYPVVSVN